MPQATRTTTINVTPEQFLTVVTDYEKYPEFLPEVKKITVANRTANAADVTYEIDVVKRIQYTVHLVQDGLSVKWNLVRGDLMKKNDGGWQLRREPGDRTHATYSVEIAFGGLIPIPASIATMLTETQLPTLLENFRKRAERLFPRPGGSAPGQAG